MCREHRVAILDHLSGDAFNGLVLVASLIGGPLAPGSLIRIEGSGLGPSLPVEAALEENLPGPTALASTRIVINGRPAVLLSVSAAAVTAIVPSDLPVTQSADVQAERALDIGTLRSNSVTMPLARFSPAVFSRNGLGAGAALAFNQDGTPNTFENPAISPGTIDLIVNGAGPVDPRLPDGFLVPSNSRPAALPSSVEVFFRAAPANVVSATNIPGELSNKARIRFRVPVIGDGVVESSIFVRIGGVVAPAGTRVFARKP